MKTLYRIFYSLFVLILGSCAEEPAEEWVELFNGKDLSGWQANESPGTFKVVDGVLIANGLRSHLFYVGNDDKPAVFKNFELTFDAMTHHLANSGVYFHTAHQKEGWLETGYELQVNSTHHGAGGYKEVKKGGSLYGVRNLYKAYTKDSVWYQFNLRVDGKHIKIKIDDQLVVDYTEPGTTSSAENKKTLSSGTFALQGHDPESTVYFKNIRVKRLPDTPSATKLNAADDSSKILAYQANHFAFIDYNIPTENPFNIDSALAAFYNTGINIGLVMEAEKLQPGKETQTLAAHVRSYSKLPVFLGISKSGTTSLEHIPEQTLATFDYVIGDLTRFENSAGQKVDIVKEINIGEADAFMDDYVKAITIGLDNGDFDIWSMATILPQSLSEEYDKLWTTARMTKVIEAAKRNSVAIEVNNSKRVPSITFLKHAKEKGCLFTTGGLYKEYKMSQPDYFFEVIDQCKLDYKDIYIAGNTE
jgi:hypothetical protein